METIILNPVNGRKSFYGKCKVEKDGSIYALYSYGIGVARYDEQTKDLEIYEYHSITTGTHINAFLDFFGIEKMTKKQILSYIEYTNKLN